MGYDIFWLGIGGGYYTHELFPCSAFGGTLKPYIPEFFITAAGKQQIEAQAQASVVLEVSLDPADAEFPVYVSIMQPLCLGL